MILPLCFDFRLHRAVCASISSPSFLVQTIVSVSGTQFQLHLVPRPFSFHSPFNCTNLSFHSPFKFSMMQTWTLETRSAQDRSNSPLSRIESSISLREYLTHTRVYPHVLPQKLSLSTLTPSASLTLPYDHELVLAQAPFATHMFASRRPSIFFTKC
jgi:hypothetical protein